jgi:hypothetical protein
MGLQHNPAHAEGFGFGEPQKFRFAFALFGGEFEVNVAVNVDGAFHHVVV